MVDFRHNLTPREIKLFLKTITPLSDHFLIRFCQKSQRACPRCGRNGLCVSGAVSLYCSHFDKTTHEIVACLQCGFQEVITLLTVEKM
jgi:hypothetical protein